MSKNSQLPDHVILGDIKKNFKSWLDQQDYSSYFFLVDSSSSVYCLPEIVNIHPDIEWHIIEIPMGEQFKTITTCSLIWEELLSNGADRKSLMVNLGGGVIGDMGGFAAGTYMRGIDFVNIPTTLLAMVDASVGSKVAVDFHLAKNIVGLFRDPVAVFIDTHWLKTLPEEDIRSGWAEVIKHTLIADEKAFRKMQKFDSFSQIDWKQLIRQSISIKYDIVRRDPLEKGLRKGLNFGHTIGHAVETLFLETGAPRKHGECIAIGMAAEAYISHQLVGLPESELNAIGEMIRRWFEPITLPKKHFQRIISLIAHDKKNRKGIPAFALTPRIGSFIIDQTAGHGLILDSLDYYNRLMA